MPPPPPPPPPPVHDNYEKVSTSIYLGNKDQVLFLLCLILLILLIFFSISLFYFGYNIIFIYFWDFFIYWGVYDIFHALFAIVCEIVAVFVAIFGIIGTILGILNHTKYGGVGGRTLGVYWFMVFYLIFIIIYFVLTLICYLIFDIWKWVEWEKNSYYRKNHVRNTIFNWVVFGCCMIPLIILGILIVVIARRRAVDKGCTPHRSDISVFCHCNKGEREETKREETKE